MNHRIECKMSMKIGGETDADGELHNQQEFAKRFIITDDVMAVAQNGEHIFIGMIENLARAGIQTYWEKIVGLSKEDALSKSIQWKNK